MIEYSVIIKILLGSLRVKLNREKYIFSFTVRA